jgi:hypothetical protein
MYDKLNKNHVQYINHGTGVAMVSTHKKYYPSLKCMFLCMSILLLFQGCHWNDPFEKDEHLLYFTSTPLISVYHNDFYTHRITAKGRTSSLTYNPLVMPEWLEFNCDSQTLSGTTTADNLGSHHEKISVSDQIETRDQDFDIKVELRKVAGGSWTTHTPYQWTHDGKPLAGENCIVYSDAAKDESKLFISEKTENSFRELKELLQINNNDIFVFPPGTNKIDFYVGNSIITDVDKLNAWLASRITLPGAGNPVKIHAWNDFPSQVQQEKSQGLWYPMFELAVRYILDNKGYGKTMSDIEKLFLDLRSTNSFYLSFERMTGTTLENFENNFFNLIIPFLQD